MKLWSGRFQKDTNAKVNDFNSSISFDQRLYKEDIEGSIAHSFMLGETGIISKEESALIQNALAEILKDIESGTVEFDIDAEDIHMNVEKLLISRIGDTGKKLHTARSRNDQVALDMRMYVKEQINNITALLIATEKVLLKKAEENLDTILPGFTHLQRAQPVTLAHHITAYCEMFKRDIERLKDCSKRIAMPLGSGALATSTYPLNRKLVAERLNFEEITLNSMDGVSDRDFCIELLSCISTIMMHLSRFSEEIILWCSSEFNFIELDDAYSTGSSIMPQKKNPDIAELVRGKTGRVYGSLMTMLTVMKGLPLAYNKDMQEDKECVFDAVDTVKMCLPVFSDMIDTMKINKASMYKAASGGFTNATDAADYLVKKGVPFRTAHSIIGQLVFYCIQKEKTLEQLSIEEYKQFSDIFDSDIYDAISLAVCVSGRKVIGGPAPERVLEHIKILKDYIS